MQRQGGHGLTGHCSGQSIGGSVRVPWSPWALPFPLIKSLPTAPPHAVLWAQDALSPRPEPVLAHPPKELQKVSSRLHKENKCGLCRCLACVLVWRSNEVFIEESLQQDPSRDWANTRATDCKQAEGPALGLGPRLSPVAAACFPALLALHSHTESFQRPPGEQRIHVPTPAHTCLTPSQGSGPCQEDVHGPGRTPGVGSMSREKLRLNPMLPGVPRRGSDEGRARWTRRGTFVAVGGAWPGGSCATEQGGPR